MAWVSEHIPNSDARSVDLSVDPRDAVIAKQAVEIEELSRALSMALNKMQQLDNILGNARQHTRMHG